MTTITQIQSHGKVYELGCEVEIDLEKVKNVDLEEQFRYLVMILSKKICEQSARIRELEGKNG